MRTNQNKKLLVLMTVIICSSAFIAFHRGRELGGSIRGIGSFILHKNGFRTLAVEVSANSYLEAEEGLTGLIPHLLPDVFKHFRTVEGKLTRMRFELVFDSKNEVLLLHFWHYATGSQTKN